MFSQNKATTGTGTSFGTGAATGTGAAAGAKTTFGGFGGGTGFGFGKGVAKQPTYQAQLTKDPLFDRLYNIRCAYNPNKKGYKFCYVFYNRKPNTSDEPPKCPANIELDEWVKIMKDCPDPDHLVPTAVCGFEQLHSRVEAQQKMQKELSDRMKLLQSKLREMTSFYSTELSGSLERIKKNTQIITQLMMEAVAQEEVQRGQGNPLTPKEEEMYRQLEALNLELHKPGEYKDAISNLRNKVERMKERQSNTHSKMAVDKDTLKVLATALRTNEDAIEALQTATKNAKRTIDTLSNEVDNL